MRSVQRLAFWACLILLIVNVSEASMHGGSTMHHDAKLILVIFDGFRYDFLEKTDTPNFDRLVNEGVKPASVIPAFMTKTFSGQTTIATGLYQESHGILANRMFDPVFNATFSVSSIGPRWWRHGGEPIWATYQREGGRTTSVNFFGDSVNITGRTATYHLPEYVESMPFQDRVDIVVGHMGNGSANLGLLYFHEPDDTAHREGPDSNDTYAMVRACDRYLGYLLDQLTNASLIDEVNIIVTSDHGFTTISPNQTVFLDDYIDPNMYFYTDNNPVFSIWPHKENDTQRLYNDLVGRHPRMFVYLREDMPEDLHYRDNRRISPILVIMDDGWNVATNNASGGKWSYRKGNHGFLNTDKYMENIFIAAGPAFKTGVTSNDSINSVDIYNLMCRVLSISPAPNNGTFSNVEWMLNEPSTDPMMITSDANRHVAPFTLTLLSLSCVFVLTYLIY